MNAYRLLVTDVISLREAWLSPWKARGSSHIFLTWFLGCINVTAPAKPCQGFESSSWISEFERILKCVKGCTKN